MVPDVAPRLAERDLHPGTRTGPDPVRPRRHRPAPGHEALTGIAGEVRLDGELVVGAGRAEDFYALAPASPASRGRIRPCRSGAFDLLWLDGELLTASPPVPPPCAAGGRRRRRGLRTGGRPQGRGTRRRPPACRRPASSH